MKFAEKKQAYQQMQDPAHLCCDRELLEKKSPKSPALRTGIVDKVKAQREILWALLDVATVEEIEGNRNLTSHTSEELIRLIALISAPVPDTKEAIKETDHTVCGLLDVLETAGIKLSDEQINSISAFKGLLSETLNQICETEAENERLATIEELLTLDLEKATQPVLAKIARTLKLDPNPDYKAATLRPQLDAYRSNLPKVSEGSGVEMIPVEEHLEIVNELAEENENLQEQLGDVESEKEFLEEQLEEEKKSEATPDPE